MIPKSLVYVAGPYRAVTLDRIQYHIEQARQTSVRLAKMGYFPMCPHTMEGLTMNDVQQDEGGEFWLEGTLEMMRRCDTVVVQGLWQFSSGTLGEIHEAFKRELPLYNEVYPGEFKRVYTLSSVNNGHYFNFDPKGKLLL
jgi:hypothetical protein